MIIWRAVRLGLRTGKQRCPAVDKHFCNCIALTWLGSWAHILTPLNPNHRRTLEKLRWLLAHRNQSCFSANVRLLDACWGSVMEDTAMLQACPVPWGGIICWVHPHPTFLCTSSAILGCAQDSNSFQLHPCQSAVTAAIHMDTKSLWITASLTEHNTDTMKQRLFDQYCIEIIFPGRVRI